MSKNDLSETQPIAYKKMAGTSAVFLRSDFKGPSPVERDGETWTPDELHLPATLDTSRQKPPMANALALEGLEEYDPPLAGDIRQVNSLGVNFVYSDQARAWIQIAPK